MASEAFDCTIFHRFVFSFQLEVNQAEILVSNIVPKSSNQLIMYYGSYLLHMSYAFDCTIFHRLVFSFQLEVKPGEIFVSNIVPKSLLYYLSPFSF